MTVSKIPGILSALRSEIWALQPHKLEAIVELLELRAQGIRFGSDEIAERIGAIALSAPHAAAGASPASKGGKVAVIPLTGVIAQHSRMVNQVSTPSGTSCEDFAKSFDTAMADPNVQAIVIDCDSPGGSTSGVPELASRIMQARGKGKKIVAVANGLSASAAYWIASAADEFWVAPSGEVGSIGVFCVHEDASGMYANEGIKHTIIKAGVHKAEGNPFEPLSDDALAYVQSKVDDFYGMFVSAVAQNRGVSAKDVEANFGQGRTVTAKVAVRRGMADKVGTMEDALAQFGVSPRSKRSALAAVAEDDALPMAAIASNTFAIDAGSLTDRAFALSILRGQPATTITTDHAAADGAIALSPSAEDANLNTNRPHVAKEQPVSLDTAAPSGAPAVDATALIAAERKRVSEITALCREHNVADANLAQGMIDRGISAGDAGLEILNLKRATKQAPAVSAHGMVDREAEKPFVSLGEQLMSIVGAARHPGNIDKRLLALNAGPSGMSEQVPSDGGFALQPEFATEIIQRSYTMGEILSRVRKYPIGANSNGLKINAIDETSRVTGSRFGGVQVYHANEADTATAKKPKLRQMILELKKLLGIWYLTDELTEDTTALGAIAMDAFSEEITFTLENVILNGNGAGQGLGILNSGAVIVVPKETSQATATLNVQNITKMYARSWGRGRKNSVWLYDQSVEPQFFTMTLGSGTSQIPIYLPPGGLSATPYGTLMGRPMIPVEYMAQLGTLGDIMLVDLSQYLYIDKGGPKQAQSIHVRFLNDEMTFRITHRYDGQPIWYAPLTPANNGPTLSPYVTLAARP